MCQKMPLVERPNCSSTSAHSIRDQPWPPYSGECSPPLRRAAIPSCLIRSIVSCGRRPCRRSASCSSGIRTSSTNRRARSRSSVSSGVSSSGRLRSGSSTAGASVVVVICAPLLSPCARVRARGRRGCRSHRAPGVPRSGWASRPRSASCRVSSSHRRQLSPPAAEHQPLDPIRLRGDRRGRRIAAGAQGRDRTRQLELGLGGEREPCPSVALHCALRYHLDAVDYKVNTEGGRGSGGRKRRCIERDARRAFRRRSTRASTSTRRSSGASWRRSSHGPGSTPGTSATCPSPAAI